MSALAQIPVHGHLDQAGPLAARSDLACKVLHVFICERPTVCSFWAPEGGANAAFFLNVEDLRTEEPETETPIVPVLPEVWIEGWAQHDDLVPDEAAASFTDNTKFYALPNAWQFPHEFISTLRTKLGGMPYWTGQGPCEPPQPPFRFMLEIDRWLTVPEAAEGCIELANFCSDGTGFVFVDAEQAELPSLFLINR